MLRAELVLKREVEGALAKAPRVRTADERRLERCLDILAWCAAARRITAVACAAQAREKSAPSRPRTGPRKLSISDRCARGHSRPTALRLRER